MELAPDLSRAVPEKISSRPGRTMRPCMKTFSPVKRVESRADTLDFW